ncbi:MAG: putative hydrolase [Marinimicrobia bacterium 46_43]|jgi:NTE family protein|nr:MAG: putative hydrolase [Marinimicrobia bacterium 46_43]
MKLPGNKLKLGVALSGGGSRGLAHIGVLKELRNAGIQIDFMTGTSMGGVIAASYAAGLTPLEIEEIASSVGTISNLAQLVDPTLLKKGIFKGDKVTKLFNRYLGEKSFEDLEIPLSVTAVDLNSNQEICISDGLIADALRATISIPGIFVPVEKDGMRLVDGGLLNNLPVDIVRDMGADIILAVDVGWSGIGKEKIRESYQKIISRVPLVDMALTLYETVDLFLSRQVDDKIQSIQPDFLLRPGIPPHITSIAGYTHAKELIAFGEEATLPILADLRLSLNLANDLTQSV